MITTFQKYFFILFFLSAGASAAIPLARYLELDANGKRVYHATESRRTQYRYLSPTLVVACRQVIAVAPMLNPIRSLRERYVRQTLDQPSGPPKRFSWRAFFGKAFHPYGAMAPGEITLNRTLAGVAPGVHPVTFRFSLATAWFGGKGFRPGLLLIIHQGKGQPDVEIVMMPKTGLAGFDSEVNLLAVEYTNQIDHPTGTTKVAAEYGLGVAARDVATQFIGEDVPQNISGTEIGTSPAVWVKPTGPMAEAYERTKSADFRRRLMELEVPTGGEVLFNLEQAEQIIGSLRINETPRASAHSDGGWFIQHRGFMVR